MSHTSSSRREASAGFRRAFAWLVAGLVGLCAIFVAIGYLQGPKLSDAQIDTLAAISSPNQQLRLFANQPVADVAAQQVTVVPAAEVTVTTARDVIAVQFASPLRYDTDYVVTVDGVRGVSLPQTSSLTYTFTTPAPELLYLDRGDGPDEIIATTLSGTEREVEFSADRIQSFAVTGQVLVVASLNPDDTSRLDVVSRADGATEPILLPGDGVVSDVAASDSGSVIGFTFTPSVRDENDVLGGRTVLLLNLEAGRELTTVGALGDEPLPITDWRFVPGSTSLVVQGIEQTVFLVDSAPDSIPTPLGRFDEIVSVSRDGGILTARDGMGAVFVSLADAQQTRFEPSLIQGGQPFLGQIEALADGTVIEKAALQTTDGRFAVVIAVDDGADGRVLYQTPNLAGSIEEFSVSPNGQYVAIEVVPIVADSVSDGYPQNSRSTSITTVVVEIETGLIVRSVEGFNLLW